MGKMIKAVLQLSAAFIVSSAILSCTDADQKTITQTDKLPAMSDTIDKELSDTERSNGWKLLFDGSSLNGWRTYQGKKSDSWSVNDGTLYCKGSTSDKSDLRADLITTGQYENFELSIDWKISPQGNSGIIYLASEEFKASYLSGPEYQVIDDVGFPQKLEDWQRTGANYAMNPAPDAKTKPVGEWNNTRIVVNQGHVEHWLNGEKVVDYELWTDKWKQEKSTGKWKDAPGYGLTKKGHIALQDHGSEAWFRNIKIKEL
ncbi:MAG: DUF1080 domain-containing protein [Chitinophagaceae bacterium]